jgi:hypothetical protein
LEFFSVSEMQVLYFNILQTSTNILSATTIQYPLNTILNYLSESLDGINNRELPRTLHSLVHLRFTSIANQSCDLTNLMFDLKKKNCISLNNNTIKVLLFMTYWKVMGF